MSSSRDSSGVPRYAAELISPRITSFLPGEQYTLGTLDPPIAHDFGAGPFASQPVTADAVARRVLADRILGPLTMIYPGPNATQHLRHYLNGSGRPYRVDLENMLSHAPRSKKGLLKEFRQARSFVETLQAGSYRFTSRFVETGYNYKQHNADWYFAMAGYSRWGKGSVAITSASGGRRHYEMRFTYCVADRYNWDGGKKVDFLGFTITDEQLGELHLQGIAQEFSLWGAVDRRLIWEGNDAIPVAMLLGPALGR